MAKTLADILPKGHPLANMPYWDDQEYDRGETMLEWGIAFFKLMQTELPCKETKDIIWYLEHALQQHKDRKERRVQQGVFGTNKPHEYTALDDGSLG